jgi:hypothetical protein
MKQDLLYFTENEYYKKMIYDKGTSMVVAKTTLSLLLLPLPLLFLLNNCLNHHTHFYNNSYLGLFFILLILFSVYDCKRYLTPLINKYKSRSWKKTTAKIIEIVIFKVRVQYRYGSSIEYFPAVKYEFKVNNKIYQSCNFSFESEYVYNVPLEPNASNQYHTMNAKFAKWLDEKELQIYYDSNNPNKSVVIKDFHQFRNIFYIIFAILSISALLTSISDFICLL